MCQPSIARFPVPRCWSPAPQLPMPGFSSAHCQSDQNPDFSKLSLRQIYFPDLASSVDPGLEGLGIPHILPLDLAPHSRFSKPLYVKTLDMLLSVIPLIV